MFIFLKSFSNFVISIPLKHFPSIFKKKYNIENQFMDLNKQKIDIIQSCEDNLKVTIDQNSSGDDKKENNKFILNFPLFQEIIQYLKEIEDLNESLLVIQSIEEYRTTLHIISNEITFVTAGILWFNNEFEKKKFFPKVGGLLTFFKLIKQLLYLLKDNLKSIYYYILPNPSNVSSLVGHVVSSFLLINYTKIKLKINEIQQINEYIHSFEPIFPLLQSYIKENKYKIINNYTNLYGKVIIDDSNATIDNSDPFELHNDLNYNYEEILNQLHIEPFWYKFDSDLKKFREKISLLYASVAASYNKNSNKEINTKEENNFNFGPISLTKGLSTVIKCTIDSKHAGEIHKEVTDSIDTLLLQKIWNLPNLPLIATLNDYSLPKIAVSQLIHIIPPYDNTILQGIPIVVRIISSKPLPFSISHLLPPKINNSSLVGTLKKTLPLFSSKSEIKKKNNNNNNNKLSLPIVLHMHGGGFISGSSAMHEDYLRKWAISTGYIILSVDYKLGPQFKFPVALEECFYVYKWLLTSNDLDINISKIAVVGDSAGGNLATSLIIKAIQEEIRVPDGLLLQYPALDLCTTANPSRIIFMNDVLVSLRAAQACLKGYIPTGINTRNPLISPVHTPDEILKFFPPVYLFSAELDPLIDEGIAFANRLNKLSKLHCHIVYFGLPHGYLSLSRWISRATFAIDDTTKFLKKILLSSSPLITQ